MNLADALLVAHESIFGYPDDEDIRAHKIVEAAASFLSIPLTRFQQLDDETQVAYVTEYWTAYGRAMDSTYEVIDWGAVNNLVRSILEKLLELDGSESATSSSDDKTPTAGDKWVSPGRIVCSWPDLDITARAVMFVMAAHGDNNGAGIWISQSKIADYLGVSKRTVQRAMDRLASEKAITKTAEPRQHKPPTWRLNKGPGVT